ncbi:MAG: CHAT domain-containing protein [Chloroflexi bacterium]|nr:CHAT domain-containing protein [Chloroflexota bacterium]
MPLQNYANFDLQIERISTTYRARVLASPAGQATTEFTLPFSAAEQAAVIAANWSTSAARGIRLSVDPTSLTPALDAKTFGTRLFAALFQGDVRTCLTNSLTMTQATGTGLRIRLRLNDVLELAPLPWEYLRGPAPYDFFALSEQTPIVRYLDLLQSATLLPVTLPLRILVLISDPTDILPRLAVEGEWQRLQTVLAPLQAQGSIIVERLAARLDTLQQRLQQKDNPFHILHFIGHGAFDANRQEGGLLLETVNGQGQMVSAERLSVLLYDHPSLRLAFLNACEGARGGSTDLFAGVAQTLVQKRMPAVIAMQYTVTDSAAIDLAASFYQAIANHYPVDAALAEARKTLYVANNQLEWGTPVLFMRAPDGMLFQNLDEEEDEMSEKKPGGNVHINTGGGNYIDGGVNTGGGDFIGRNKIIYGDNVHGDKIVGDKVAGNKNTGDVINATIGAGAKNIAVGKDIHQTITENYGPPTPDDKPLIEAQFQRILAVLNAAVIDPRTAGRAEGNLETLQSELTKTDESARPEASTITRVGDWLLSNAPQLTQALAELFGMPAVGRVLNKAGEAAVAWAKERFNK